MGHSRAQLRGGRSRCEDARLGARAGAARLPVRGDRWASRIAISGGCIHLYACRSLKQHALLEQMIVEGALCSKASCVVMVEASCIFGEQEEEGLLMRRGQTAEEARSEGRKKGATVDRRGGIGID